MKKYFLILGILLLMSACSIDVYPQDDKAQGVFLGIGVGPRLPVGPFAATSDLGYGFNFEVSYTNSDYLPLFFSQK